MVVREVHGDINREYVSLSFHAISMTDYDDDDAKDSHCRFQSAAGQRIHPLGLLSHLSALGERLASFFLAFSPVSFLVACFLPSYRPGFPYLPRCPSARRRRRLAV